METLPSRDDAVAREWQTLARKLSRAEGFCFIVYFVDDQRVASELKRRLTDQLQSHGGALRVIAVEEPRALVASSMAMLFAAAPAAASSGGAPRVALWLEAFRGAGRPEWDGPREQLLMRLNERRSRLEAELRAPLVLLLPADAQRAAATLAPDLWHVRVHSAPLHPAAARDAPRREDTGLSGDARVGAGNTRLLTAPGAPSGDADAPRAVAYWREQNAVVTPHEGQPAAAQREREPMAAGVQLWDGFNAIRALLDEGSAGAARGIADDVLLLAKAQWQAVEAGGGDWRVKAERDLAQAYGFVGAVASQQTRFEDAVAALESAVAHLNAVRVQKAPVQTELFLLGTQLDRLGDALQALGQVDAASRSYEDALAQYRRLALLHGAGVIASNAVAATLLKLGDVSRLRGDWSAAAAAYAESLQLLRAMLLGADAPSRRRALASALFRMAEVAEHHGRLDEAASAYGEALAIDRRLLAETAETPQVLESLAATLTRLAALDGLSPDRQRAAAAEALQLQQRLATNHPGSDRAQFALQRTRKTFDDPQPSILQPAP